MPAVSKVQQRAAAIELVKRRAGRPANRFRSMSTADLAHYARTPRKGLPHRAASGRTKRRRAIAEIRAGG